MCNSIVIIRSVAYFQLLLSIFFGEGVSKLFNSLVTTYYIIRLYAYKAALYYKSVYKYIYGLHYFILLYYSYNWHCFFVTTFNIIYIALWVIFQYHILNNLFFSGVFSTSADRTTVTGIQGASYILGKHHRAQNIYYTVPRSIVDTSCIKRNRI